MQMLPKSSKNVTYHQCSFHCTVYTLMLKYSLVKQELLITVITSQSVLQILRTGLLKDPCF